MNEFIEKLIGRLEEKVHLYYKQYMDDIIGYSTYNRYKREVASIISIVNQLAEEYINTSTEYINCSTNGWIPVSERLPDKSGNYIVCNKHSEIWVANWFDNTWWGIEKKCRWGNIIAWQPLPPKYEPKEGGAE